MLILFLWYIPQMIFSWMNGSIKVYFEAKIDFIKFIFCHMAVSSSLLLFHRISFEQKIEKIDYQYSILCTPWLDPVPCNHNLPE